jgi:hypothetical protein
MDVYIYPQPAPFDAASRPFRDRYLAVTGVHWGTGALPQHDDMNVMNLDITGAVLDLIKGGHAGETWTMSIAVTVLPSLTTFGEPTVQETPPIH